MAHKFFQVTEHAEVVYHCPDGGPFNVVLHKKTQLADGILQVFVTRCYENPQDNELFAEMNKDLMFLEGQAPPEHAILLRLKEKGQQLNISGRVSLG